MSAYYNEHDEKAAAWLRELIKEHLIADGEVDTRSIVDVSPGDVRGFTQCHWFAGIGGWSLALRLAGWPDSRRVWTGSCPCQPFSSAGAQAGGHDPRDLWPAWFLLIEQCRPDVVFGEQVESALAHGWLDRVCDDLEGEGYALGAAGLPAASAGAFHIRQRLWFVADAHSGRGGRDGRSISRAQGESERGRQEPRRVAHEPEPASLAGELADDAITGRRTLSKRDAGTNGRPAAESRRLRDAGPADAQGRRARKLGDTDHARSQGRGCAVLSERAGQCAPRATGSAGGMADPERDGGRADLALGEPEGRTLDGRVSPWTDAEWIPCRDGKWRPVEPGTQQMVDGLSRAVGQLRDLGHAEKEALNAAAGGRFRDEVVCALRGGVQPTAIWQATGRRLGFPAALFLLADLCERERELGRVFYGAASRGTEDSQGCVRAMWATPKVADGRGHAYTPTETRRSELRKQMPAACPSPGWELPEQLASELGDLVPKLSQAGASLAGFTGGPLAHGVSARVGRLRGYGNAIVPQVAAEFIGAYLDVEAESERSVPEWEVKPA